MGSDQALGLKISGYEIVEELGTGTSTTSYRASDARGKCVVAKRLIDPLADDEVIVKKFLATSELSSKIRMKKFLTMVTGQKKSPEGVFLLREHVEGQPLSYHIENGLLDQLDANQLAYDLCDAVRALTSQGVVHGGIHPKNLIITTSGRAKLTDFGTSACVLQSKIGKQYQPSAFSYLAPEQLRGEACDAQTDIYSAGLIIALLVRGTDVFNGADFDDVKARILAGAKVDCPVIDAAIDSIRSRRYPEISKFRSGLGKFKKADTPGDEQKQTGKPAQEKQKEQVTSERMPRKQTEQKQNASPPEKQSYREDKQPIPPEQERPSEPPPNKAPMSPLETTAELGMLSAIYDIGDGSKDLLTKPSPCVLQMPKNGQRGQRAFQLSNGGTGLLRLSAKCHGKGISITCDKFEIPPNQMQPALIALAPDSDVWVNVTFRWTEAREQREVEIKFYRPG